MKKKILFLLLMLIISTLTLSFAGFLDTDGENPVSEDFELSDEIEVDSVSSATMSEYELENPIVEYTEEEIYNMTIEAILTLFGLVVAMVVPLLLRKLRGKYIGSE